MSRSSETNNQIDYNKNSIAYGQKRPCKFFHFPGPSKLLQTILLCFQIRFNFLTFNFQKVFGKIVQVNLCQKLLFLHQLTLNMTTDCSLNYKFNTWKFQAQICGEHVVYRNCFWHSEQFLYTTCSPHVLQKEELLTKIYLYNFKVSWTKINHC